MLFNHIKIFHVRVLCALLHLSFKKVQLSAIILQLSYRMNMKTSSKVIYHSPNLFVFFHCVHCEIMGRGGIKQELGFLLLLSSFTSFFLCGMSSGCDKWIHSHLVSSIFLLTEKKAYFMMALFCNITVLTCYNNSICS